MTKEERNVVDFQNDLVFLACNEEVYLQELVLCAQEQGYM
jgi:hypothetical protein